MVLLDDGPERSHDSNAFGSRYNLPKLWLLLSGRSQLAAQVTAYVIHTIAFSLVLIYFVPMFLPDYTNQALLWASI